MEHLAFCRRVVDHVRARVRCVQKVESHCRKLVRIDGDACDAMGLRFLHRLVGSGHALSCVNTDLCSVSGTSTTSTVYCSSSNLAGIDASDGVSSYTSCVVR